MRSTMRWMAVVCLAILSACGGEYGDEGLVDEGTPLEGVAPDGEQLERGLDRYASEHADDSDDEGLVPYGTRAYCNNTNNILRDIGKGGVASWFIDELVFVVKRGDRSLLPMFGNHLLTFIANAIALAKIACKESSYNDQAHSSGSKYFGRYQMSTVSAGSAGVPWHCYKRGGCFGLNTGFWQTLAALRYIRARYGSPVEAWKFHLRKNWY